MEKNTNEGKKGFDFYIRSYDTPEKRDYWESMLLLFLLRLTTKHQKNKEKKRRKIYDELGKKYVVASGDGDHGRHRHSENKKTEWTKREIHTYL